MVDGMRRVLVVEDEAAIREVIALNLRMAGYDVTEAGSAEAGLAAIAAAPRLMWRCWILCCRA